MYSMENYIVLSVLVLGWLSSCSAAAGHSDSDIPKEYKISCGTFDTCDGRTQYCAKNPFLHCESCATDVCALAKGKDDFDVQVECHAECPVYYDENYCGLFADKCCKTPTTPVVSSTATDCSSIIMEKDEIIATKDTIITVMACVLAIVVILVVIFIAAFCCRERKCRHSTPPQRDPYSGVNTEANTGTELQEVTSTGSLNGTHDSGNASSSHQSSPGGSTSRARGSNVTRPTYTIPDQSTQGLQNLGNSGGPPQVDLDPFIGEPQMAAVHGPPVSPTQMAREEGQPSGGGNAAAAGVYLAQPQNQPSLDGKNLDPRGKDVPEPGRHSHSTQNIVASPEDSSSSPSKMAVGRYDTDGSRAPLLGADSSDETSLKQRFTE